LAQNRVDRTINDLSAGDLDWLLVLLTRRNWTSLSFTVFSAFLWTLVSSSGTSLTSSLWWLLALSTIGGLSVWLWTRQRISKVNGFLSDRPLKKPCTIDRLADC